MPETLYITKAFNRLDDIPVDDEKKKQLLIDEILPMLYAFEGKQSTISIELTPTSLNDDAAEDEQNDTVKPVR